LKVRTFSSALYTFLEQSIKQIPHIADNNTAVKQSVFTNLWHY